MESSTAGREYCEDLGAVRCRSLIPEDRTGWNTLWDAYNEFYGRSGLTALPAAVTEATWSKLLGIDPGMVGVVAVGHDGTKVIGFANLVFHPSTTSIEPFCYLEDLYVCSSTRRRRVGARLIEAAAEVARARGAIKLYWQTNRDNAVARRLYDSVATYRGFVVYDQPLSISDRLSSYR